jgi:hypothetical protein
MGSRVRPVVIENLERRLLRSASYVRVGAKIRPSILAATPSYFAHSLPAGEYLIQVVGGSLSYSYLDNPVYYSVNDYGLGDHGYKVIAPGTPRFNAPGSSNRVLSSVTAADQSKGVYLKFYHPVAGKIGIELYDNPYWDNIRGAAGAPVFELKERVAPAAGSEKGQSLAAVSSVGAPVFSSNLISAPISPMLHADSDADSQDELALLTD